LTPASESSQKAADGLTYYIFNRRNLAAGEKLDITISYSKTDSGLSAPQLVAPAGGTAQSSAVAVAPAATSSTSVLPWILIGLGVLLLVGILVYWLMSRRSQAAPTTVASVRPAAVRPGRSTSPVRPTVPARRPGEGVTFCTSCGHALKADDRFCSQCGAPRRS
jgi:hypothetical protein